MKITINSKLYYDTLYPIKNAATKQDDYPEVEFTKSTCYSINCGQLLFASCVSFSSKYSVVLTEFIISVTYNQSICTLITSVFCSILHKQFYSSPQGAHLLYQSEKNPNKTLDEFSSPRRGPIFSTFMYLPNEKEWVKVSVPSKRTHLLYR